MQTGAGFCTCACYDAVNNSYCGACDFGNTPLCPSNAEVAPYNNLTAVCRDRSSGYTAFADVYIANPYAGASCDSFPDCDNLLAQMITQIAGDLGISEANVIISGAMCSSTFAPTASPTPSPTP